MAAFDMDDPKAVVSPGGVGFDINCGVRRISVLLEQYLLLSTSCSSKLWLRAADLQVRLLRTNLREKDVQPVKEQLAQSLFDHIPVSSISDDCDKYLKSVHNSTGKMTGRGW